MSNPIKNANLIVKGPDIVQKSLFAFKLKLNVLDKQCGMGQHLKISEDLSLTLLSVPFNSNAKQGIDF